MSVKLMIQIFCVQKLIEMIMQRLPLTQCADFLCQSDLSVSCFIGVLFKGCINLLIMYTALFPITINMAIFKKENAPDSH